MDPGKTFDPVKHTKRREIDEGSQGLIPHQPGERPTIQSVFFRVFRVFSGLSTAGFKWIAGLLLAVFVGVSIPADAAAPTRLPPASFNADELFTNAALPRLRIEIPSKGMEVLRAYQWEWGGKTPPRTNVLATVREGDTVYSNVAIHLKGAAGSFRPIDSTEPALTLNFDKHAEGQRFHGLQKLHLNNSVQDPTCVSEQLARELFNAVGVPVPRASHAMVTLNGRDLGLYVLVEGWNKQFLKRHFKNANGYLWDGGFGQDIDKPLELNSGDEPEDRHRLDDLIALYNEPDLAVRWRELQRVLDMDRFLTFAALEVMLSHWDGYSMGHNNYRVYHDPDSDRLVFLPHGLDQLFGVARSSPTSLIAPMMKGLAARAVLQVPEGRRRYLDRMSELLTNIFIAEKLTQRVDAIAADLRPALRDADIPDHERNVSVLKNRIERRVRSVTQQLVSANTPVAFDTAGEAPLKGWEARRDSGNPSFTRNRGAGETLNVSATGSRAYGTWRTTVLLERGEYQFIGKVKTEELELGQDVVRGGVTLRQSGERAAKMTPSAPEWTTLTYDFEVLGLTDVELLCELRASNGRALFDVKSLKLLRKGPRRK